MPPHILAIQEEAQRTLLALEAEEGDDGTDETNEDDPVDNDEDESTGPIGELSDPEPGTGVVADAGEPTGSDKQAPSTPANLNDEDAKCYSSRYQDIDAMLDPKTHFTTVGIQQGRLGTCAKRLTDYEAQRYLDQNPDL